MTYALAGGGAVLADHLGHRPALGVAIAGLTLQAAALTASPFRHARLATTPT